MLQYPNAGPVVPSSPTKQDGAVFFWLNVVFVLYFSFAVLLSFFFVKSLPIIIHFNWRVPFMALKVT